jgi:hypothetical protein
MVLMGIKEKPETKDQLVTKEAKEQRGQLGILAYREPKGRKGLDL